jgi:hypothetical protein
MNFINNYLKGKFELVYTFWSSFGFYIIVTLFEKVLLLSKTNISFYIMEYFLIKKKVNELT